MKWRNHVFAPFLFVIRSFCCSELCEMSTKWDFWHFCANRGFRLFAMNTNRFAQNYLIDGPTDVSKKTLFHVSELALLSTFRQSSHLIFISDRIEIRREKSQNFVHRTPTTGASADRRWRSNIVVEYNHPAEYNFSICEYSQWIAWSTFGIAYMDIGTATVDYRFVSRLLHRCRGLYRILCNALYDHRGRTKCRRCDVITTLWVLLWDSCDQFWCVTHHMWILWTFSHQIYWIVLFWCGQSVLNSRRRFKCIATKNAEYAEWMNTNYSISEKK